ncbi:hypothetical protein [Streptomyces chrestomyceticus]
MIPAGGAIKARKDTPRDVVAPVGCAAASGVGAVAHPAKVKAGSTAVAIA